LTAAQRTRLHGFNASLKQRGVLLVLEGTESGFNALVQPVGPDQDEFSVSHETRSASKIHILRSSGGIEQISIGSVLKDSDSGTSHRVTQVDDHPTNIALVFHCETAAD
jgi:hypothetical protein